MTLYLQCWNQIVEKLENQNIFQTRKVLPVSQESKHFFIIIKCQPSMNIQQITFQSLLPWDHRYFPPGTVSTVGGKVLFMSVGT